MKLVKRSVGATKTVLGCLVLGLLLLGGSLRDQGLAQDQEFLEFRLGFTNPDGVYLLNPDQPEDDPITAVVTVENVSGRPLLATRGYADNLHLRLRFTGPDTLQITAHHLLSGSGGRSLPVFVDEENVKYVPGEPIEDVGYGEAEEDRSFSVPINVRNFYDFRIPGPHLAQLFVPMGLYETESRIPGTDYARVEERIFGGDGTSNALTIILVDDADGDGHCFPVQHPDLCANPEPDCDDSNPSVNPGATEIPNNGLDDDCNPATPDYQLVEYGTIEVSSFMHTVGLGSRPGSTMEPICLHLRVFDKSPGSCLMQSYGVSHRYYEQVWNGCPNVVQGNAFTDAAGTASLNVAAPGDYVLIGQYDPDRGATCLGESNLDNDEVYLGVSAGDLQLNQIMRKRLQLIVKANDKIVPAKYTKKEGSELLIIEPEYVEWNGTQELYPFVFESVGDWTVTTSVSPPEGFVADQNSLTEDVFTEVEAVQFTITDVGSKWEPTEVTYELTHGNKRETVSGHQIDVKLPKELAEALGLTVWGEPLEEQPGKRKGKGKGKGQGD